MSLFTYEDIEHERNIDLTDPNGQELTTTLIDAVVAWAEGEVDYPLEQTARTTYFADGETTLWLPTRAPVSDLTLSYKRLGEYLPLTTDQLDYDGETGQVESLIGLPSGMKAVKAEYTAGWTAETLPKDLRKTLMDLVVISLQQINNLSSSAPSDSEAGGEVGEDGEPTGKIKKYSVDGFSVEFSTTHSDAYWKAKAAQMAQSVGDDVPLPIQKVVDRYKKVYAYSS